MAKITKNKFCTLKVSFQCKVGKYSEPNITFNAESPTEVLVKGKWMSIEEFNKTIVSSYEITNYRNKL
jgi:hypothetical protein